MFFQKRMLHLLEDPFIEDPLKTHCIFSKEKCNLMKPVSLQTGGISLLHFILHFKTKMHYVKFIIV